MSSYQADWLVGDEGEWNEDDDEEGENGGEEGEGEANEMQEISGEGAPAITEEEEVVGVDEDDMDDGMSFGGSMLESVLGGPPTKSFSANRTKQQLADDDLEFPDEMDTPDDVAARVRFARYRALLSFRSSPWHPKENLPIDYSRIFQFENFSGAQRR